MITIGKTVFIFVQEIPDTYGYWREITQAELDSALEHIDYMADEWDGSMSDYDNFNIWMLTVEDRRFKSIANYLEGTGP